MTVQYDVARRLLIRPGTFDGFSGTGTANPLLLVPEGQFVLDSVINKPTQQAVAAFAPSYPGKRHLLIMPQLQNVTVPVNDYKIVPMFRIRSVESSNATQGRYAWRIGDVRGETNPGTSIPLAPAWISLSQVQDIVWTSVLPFIDRTDFSVARNVYFGTGPTEPLAATPWMPYAPALSFVSEGDEIGFLVYAEEQDLNTAVSARNWGPTDEELFTLLGDAPSQPPQGQGAWLLSGIDS